MDAIESLSDNELRGQLLSNGVDAPPVTATTRSVMERKLFRILYDEPTQEESDRSDEEAYVERTPPKPASSHRGDSLHAAGLVGPSYRRRPLHEEAPSTPSRAAPAKTARARGEQANGSSRLTRYLLILLGLIIIVFVVYFILNSDPFDSNPVISMDG